MLAMLPVANAQPETTTNRLFELSAPGLDKPSIAILSDEDLIITDPSGTQNVYLRSNRYDTQDGMWIGYGSREAKQVIRWPASNKGPMQIGTLREGNIQFTTSRMKVSQLVRKEDNPRITKQTQGKIVPILPESGIEPPGMELNLLTPSQVPKPSSQQSSATGFDGVSVLPMHFSVGPDSTRQFLSLRGSDQFGLVPRATDISSAWYVAPVGNGLFRLQQQIGNQWLAIGVDGRLRGGARMAPGTRHPVTLFPISNNIGQLWRINPFQSGYCFESVHFPGMALTWNNPAGLFLQPIVYDPWQVWYPQQPVISLPPPQFRSVQQQVVPNPELPPIDLILQNNHRDEVLVLLADRRMPDNPQKIRIPAGKSESVSIQRDAGATIVESIEVMDLAGNWSQQQYTTPIPPSVLYDISVYEIFLQSIAIDRTGKSPNPIEDINMQPRSIGFFLVPPGDTLREGSGLDVYRVANDAKNPGAVRRLSPRDLKQGEVNGDQDPLRAILKQFQKQRAAF
ncbi:MAG: hypothetical protein MUC83_00760 [Pirellula sp.]|jgi:hypothetical protein|nr:hypothetical protein [Pirellula sp.]